ncbi:MAG: hypothetical protein IPQ03_12515 [Bacteroidetes bacterium]|nr:hypothetical protein [Bacteroidota bacterium]
MKINLLLSFIFFSLISNDRSIQARWSGKRRIRLCRKAMVNCEYFDHQVCRDSAGTFEAFSLVVLGGGPYGIKIVGYIVLVNSGSSVRFLLSSAAPVLILNVEVLHFSME